VKEFSICARVNEARGEATRGIFKDGAGWSIRSVDANWTFDLERGATVVPFILVFDK